MEIPKKALGEGHPDYATSLNNLAVLYQAMGDYAAPSRSTARRWRSGRRPWARATPTTPEPEQPGRAVPVHGRLRPRRAALPPGAGDPKKALGESHPDYAASLNNLAGLY